MPLMGRTSKQAATKPHRTGKKAAAAPERSARKTPKDTEPLRLEAERRWAKAEQHESRRMRRKQTRVRRRAAGAAMEAELSQAQKKIKRLEHGAR